MYYKLRNLNGKFCFLALVVAVLRSFFAGESLWGGGMTMLALLFKKIR